MNVLKNLLLKLDIKSIIILGLIGMLLITNMCSSDKNPYPPLVKVGGKRYEVVKHTIDTVTIVKTKTVYKPGKTIWTSGPISRPVPPVVDTTAILKDYYAKYIYKDTLKLDNDLGSVNIIDTICKNKIVGRTWNSNIKQQIIHDNTIVKELPRTQVYIGAMFGFNQVNIVDYAGPALILKTKKDRIYSLGIGYATDKTVSIQGGLFWKIKLRR